MYPLQFATNLIWYTMLPPKYSMYPSKFLYTSTHMQVRLLLYLANMWRPWKLQAKNWRHSWAAGRLQMANCLTTQSQVLCCVLIWLQINCQVLGAALWHSLGRGKFGWSYWQPQTQGVSESAAVAAGCYWLSWVHWRCQKVAKLRKAVSWYQP